MSKVLLFSDTHVSNPGTAVKGKDNAKLFRAVLEKAAKEHPDAACAVVCGDLVHWGGPGEYTEFQACLDDQPWPIHLMLGNHDNRKKFTEAFPNAPRTATGHIQQVIDLGSWRLVLLDSHDETFAEPFHSGILCEDRIAWLQAQLARSTDKQVVVFVHHPPMRTFFDGMDQIGLRNTDQLLDVLEQHQNIRHIISGHIHRTISGTTRGLPISVISSAARQSPLTLDDAATDKVNEDPPGFAIMLLHESGVTLHNDHIGQHGCA